MKQITTVQELVDSLVRAAIPYRARPTHSLRDRSQTHPRHPDLAPHRAGRRRRPPGHRGHLRQVVQRLQGAVPQGRQRGSSRAHHTHRMPVRPCRAPRPASVHTRTPATSACCSSSRNAPRRSPTCLTPLPPPSPPSRPDLCSCASSWSSTQTWCCSR
jgi:hypothetical protein